MSFKLSNICSHDLDFHAVNLSVHLGTCQSSHNISVSFLLYLAEITRMCFQQIYTEEFCLSGTVLKGKLCHMRAGILA